MTSINSIFQKIINDKRSFLEILIIFWFIIASLYLIRTPYDHRTHDIKGHINYTKFLVQNKHIPNPYDGWETFQPPLYYVINSFISPDTFTSDEIQPHVNYVRFVSVIYGAIALLLIAWLSELLKIDFRISFLSLFFLATTPKFVLIFSTYNNDSLSTLLCIGIIVISYKLYLNYSKDLALILLLLSTAGLHTKFTVSSCIVAVILICSKNLLKRKLPDESQKKIITLMMISILLLVPFVYFRNYKTTGKLFPHNTEMYTYKKLTPQNAIGNLSGVLKIPFLNPDEWQYPWLSTVEGNSKEPKKRDFLAYSFVSSTISKYVADTPDKNFAWAILIIHMIIVLTSLKYSLNSQTGKLSLALIISALILQLVFSVQYILEHNSGVMDFRYIAWSWVPWTMLLCNSLSVNSNLSKLVKLLLYPGIVLHIYFLLTVSGGVSRF